jgi:CubicO group peptidase (beta-lactamase class C family)
MISALDLAAVDAVFSEFWASAPAPSLAYGVVAAGRLVHFRGLGALRTGGPAPTPDSVFRIASMTKSFTAAALLLLRDEGQLRLDDPVAQYVPLLAALRGPTSDSRSVTLRDLATMSAGFPTDNAWGDRQLSLSAAEFDALLADGLRFASSPGTAFEYSNLGYAVLGRALAAAAGTEYRAIVSSRLLRRLGMSASVFEASRVNRDDLALGHRPAYAAEATNAGDVWVELPTAGPGEFAAMGGLFSSVSDLARWIGELADAFPARDGKEVDHPLSRASRREMQTACCVIPPAAPDSVADGDAPGGLLSGSYGMGLAVAHDPIRGVLVGHPGGLPGFGSAMRWHPASGIGVVALANATYAAVDAPVMAALDGLVDATSGKAVATLWPETLDARDNVTRLLLDWNDELAGRIFAENVALDAPLEQRRAEAARIRDRLGDLHVDASAPVETSSPAQLTWWMVGESGRVRVAISLCPVSPPAIQSLELTPWPGPVAQT